MAFDCTVDNIFRNLLRTYYERNHIRRSKSSEYLKIDYKLTFFEVHNVNEGRKTVVFLRLVRFSIKISYHLSLIFVRTSSSLYCLARCA